MRAAHSLKGRLAAGGRVYVLLIDTADPTIVELAAHSGFDLVCLDLEHGAISDLHAVSAVRAGDAVGIPLMVRVHPGELPRATRFLDAGGIGAIIAHVSTPGELSVAMTALLYPPAGRRGVGATRQARLGFDGTDSRWAQAQNERLILGAQIEDRTAVDNAHHFASQPYVDVVLVGTRDLSFDLGVPGEFTHPSMIEAVEKVRLACTSQAALGLVAPTVQDASHLDAQFVLISLAAMFKLVPPLLGPGPPQEPGVMTVQPKLR
jgi:2-keto-3-deoxy-L-rhamnonate aldolase RhmA